jgi:hypothetical protein
MNTVKRRTLVAAMRNAAFGAALVVAVVLVVAWAVVGFLAG